MLTALMLSALAAPATGLATIQYGTPPPNFAIPAARGGHYLTDLRGRVVVIDFWATWCHVCTDEMDDFVRAQQDFGSRVAVVTISDEDPGVASEYFGRQKIGLPLVEDPLSAIFRLYSVSRVPVTLVLTPGGSVSYVSVGALNWTELDQAIEHAQASPGSG
ncbi:MAG: TlpA family protein disulfide reductase [Candidatus Eremiobacteraeota bacterium]|nr:TlpA family protein disulfide reductase [Candidatus Eremiobacteraeota bacterium]